MSMQSALRLHEYDPQVNKGRVQSLIVTFVTGVLILLFCWLVTIMKITNPPEGQVELFAIGMGDFGNLTDGSGNRNSFQDPSPTDAPDEKSGSKPPKGDPDSRDRNVPIAIKNRVITGNDPNADPVPVTQAPKFPTKPNTNNPVVNPKPASTQQGTGESNSTAPSNTNNPGGGANDGTGTDIGDFGGMNVPQDGTVEFGNGKFGLSGRRLVGYVKPAYRPNRDEKIDFLVEIRPDGTVLDVEGFGNPTMVNDGMMAIRQWRFNKVKTTQNQKVKVSITFKQK
jgi:hypothetical protein